MSGILGIALLLLAAGASGAAVGGTSGALREGVTAALNGANPWRAMRLAEQWAALPGLPSSERADALIEDAQARAMVGDYAGAALALRQALKARPGDAVASFLLAQATREHPARALRSAERAARASGAPGRRAAAYRLAAEIRLDLGDLPGARDDVAKALKLAPDDLDALVLAAHLRADPKQARQAALAACAAADGQPSWRRAAAERVCARVLTDLKDYPAAMAAAGRALALDEDDSDTLRVILRIKKLDPSQSLPHGGAVVSDRPVTEVQARRALKDDPDDLAALSRLVAAEQAAGRKAAAAKLAERFTAAILLSPEWQRLDAYRQSARQWLQLGDAGMALASMERAEDLDTASVPNERLVGRVMGRYFPGAVSEAYGDAAQLRVAIGDPAGADATLERGLKLCPDSQEFLRLLAERKLAESKPREALPYAEQMVALAKKAANPAYWNPDKQGLVSGGDGAKQGDLQNARQLLATVRKAIAGGSGGSGNFRD
ncbi:MAG: hypothetical protein KGM24_01105 [Elusimicrobia bacterium]|nr:hypothetical protein [Elusimicrobiota bacterium]